MPSLWLETTRIAENSIKSDSFAIYTGMPDKVKRDISERIGMELFPSGGRLAMAAHQTGFRSFLFNKWTKSHVRGAHWESREMGSGW